MSSVTETVAPGSPYTWSASGGAWNSGDGGKSWSNYAPYVYTAAISENWTTAESRALSALKSLADSWRTTESLSRAASFVRSIAEAWNTAENAVHYAQFHIQVLEAWRTIDVLANSTSKPLGDGWTTAEAKSLLASKGIGEGWTTSELRSLFASKALSDAWATSELRYSSFSKPLSDGWMTSDLKSLFASKALSEHWTTAELESLLTSKSLSEGWATSELKNLLVGKGINETWTTSELKSFVFSKLLADAWNTAESIVHFAQFHIQAFEAWKTSDPLSNSVSKTMPAESFKTADLDSLGFAKSVSEGFATSDYYSRVVAYVRSMQESITTAENVAKSTGKGLSESWRSTEQILKGESKAAADGWATTDARNAAFSKSIQQTLTTGEMLSNQPGKNFFESWLTSDSIVKAIGKAVNEGWTTAEAMGRSVGYIRSIQEGFTTAEAVSKAMSLNKQEAFHLFELYKRHANGVISDILIQASDMTLEEFADALDNGAPPFYSDFQNFVAGDYLYQTALFRAVMDATTSDRGVIDVLQAAVNLPDVIDRGTCVIATASTGVAVTFTKKFNVVPEITFSITGGSTLVAVPVVTSKSTTGFTVMLKDTSGNAYAGSLSWAASGY